MRICEINKEKSGILRLPIFGASIVQAHSMLDDIIANLARERGIDEELKVTDMLKWVAEMNNIKASAEEIVLREVVLV